MPDVDPPPSPPVLPPGPPTPRADDPGGNAAPPVTEPAPKRSIPAMLAGLFSPLNILAGFGFLAAGFAVWQFATFREEGPVTAASVAASWNSSIAKLGITPVFPPEEDLHVGDVWAVVEDADENQAILGKAVRIAHINLREDLKREAGLKRPTFSATAELEDGKRIRRQNYYEIEAAEPNEKIKLSLALFPGITITKSTQAAGILDRIGLNLGIASGRVDAESIKIPVSETYGIAAGTAAARLDLWCKHPTTELYCRDEFLRRVMAFAVSDGVLATKDGAYVAKIQLRLVNRVFMTREIEHRRARDVSLSGSARASGPSAEPPAGSSDPSALAEARIKALESRVSALLSGGAGATYARADGNELAMNQILERPVVFGFRAVTTSVKPSAPGEGRER